jgi:hypothetical protein
LLGHCTAAVTIRTRCCGDDRQFIFRIGSAVLRGGPGVKLLAGGLFFTSLRNRCVRSDANSVVSWIFCLSPYYRQRPSPSAPSRSIDSSGSLYERLIDSYGNTSQGDSGVHVAYPHLCGSVIARIARFKDEFHNPGNSRKTVALSLPSIPDHSVSPSQRRRSVPANWSRPDPRQSESRRDAKCRRMRSRELRIRRDQAMILRSANSF